MSRQLRVRIRHGQGKHCVLTTDADALLWSLLEKVEEVSGVSNPQVLVGFPPKPAKGMDVATTTVVEAGIRSGDTLICKAGGPDRASSTGLSSSESKSKHKQAAPDRIGKKLSEGWVFQRYKVPDDNSCLFTSVGFVMTQMMTLASDLRQVCAERIRSNPTTYTSTILECDPVKYTQRLLDPKWWGGAIELGILSQHFGCEIAILHSHSNKVVAVYGEGKDYNTRSYLLYNGIHYDAIACVSSSNKDQQTMQTQFHNQDDDAMMHSLSILQTLHDNKEWTNVSSLSLKCDVCGKGFKGPSQAQEHAVATSHRKFSEYN